MSYMVKDARVEFRCSAEAVASVGAWAERQKVSRSEAWRRVMAAGLASLAGKTSAAPVVIQERDVAELRWWRAFGEKVLVSAPLAVIPGTDLAGWSFSVIGDYDTDLEPS